MFSLYSGAAMVPVDLRCDGMGDSPTVCATPQLTWHIKADASDARGQVPSAWQILVASSEDTLAMGQGDIWDSGKVPAKRSPGMRYSGQKLTAGQRCHWKVRAWDAAGKVSVWSQPAAWEVAPQSPADWHGARWIDDGRENATLDVDLYKPDPAPLMRRDFEVIKPVVRARLHVAGLGWYVPSLNGSRVGDHVLDPPWTAFDKRILFSTHDVTQQLVSGKNCLGFALGNGWYNPLPLRMWGHRNIRASLTTGRPRVIAYLVVDHPDNTSTMVVTGSGWKTTPSEVISNSVYLGEVRDARRAIPGWGQPSFDDSAWKPARVTDASLDPLRAMVTPPVRAAESVPAVAVTTPAPGVHIVDIGRNFTGVAEIKLDAPAGTKVTFRYGELLHEDGTLNPMTSVCGQIKGTRKGPDGKDVLKGGPGAPNIAWQQDVYITRGDDNEVYRPDFTFHGFRYMEVTGLPQAPAASDVIGIPLYSDLTDVGSFSCSNDRLNQIQKMCRNTFLSNVVSVQSDCPHRERLAYGGDIVATSETFLMNFDMAGFYAKTVRDWADGARPDGRFTDTAPFVGIDYCGVGWAMVHPLLLEQLHRHYGADRLLAEQVPNALRWLDVEAARREDGLVVKGLSDHEVLVKARGPALTTPLFIDAARRMSRLCRLIGRDADAERCLAMADESAAAWAKTYLDADTGKVGDGSQSNQAFALGYGAAAISARPKVFNQLVEGLKAPDGPQLTTGIFGTQHLLEELSRQGRSDLAYALADRKTYPSWGWMLENDATTLWESWAGGDDTHSHNHPMFGSISGWFFRWLGGIQAAGDAVGFDRIEIRPQVVDGLEWVKCSHQSIRGLIESNWTATANALKFEIVIPVGASGHVVLPGRVGDQLTEGGKPVAQVSGVKVMKSESADHHLRLGSGRYQFTITRQP
ncbi:MAG: glycoside hydrolase family 78 protein [Verrucomicrobiae bacterium]|nr:glycoside hydrolase family 78 protein [Verrucomicrobiae bacterium]NNJ43142.1 family 78 glycoside hydrolase catalytic domain [Akkermansiaceae bacterium]